MNPDDEANALAWAEDSEKWLREAMEELKRDSEAYWEFLIKLDQELKLTERQDA